MSELFIDPTTLGDWLKQSGFSAEIHNETVDLVLGLDLKSGAVLGKVTASGKYQQVNTAASDGSQTVAGVLVNSIKSNAVAATGGTGSSGTTGVAYTASIPGAQGNSITISLVDPGANSSALAVTVAGDVQSGYEIEISLATDGGGAITTTSGDLTAALASEVAPDTGLALVTAADDGDDTTVLIADSVTLTGGEGYDTQAVVMTNLDGCLLYFSKLTYTGTAATVRSGLEALGAIMAKETAEAQS